MKVTPYYKLWTSSLPHLTNQNEVKEITNKEILFFIQKCTVSSSVSNNILNEVHLSVIYINIHFKKLFDFAHFVSSVIVISFSGFWPRNSVNQVKCFLVWEDFSFYFESSEAITFCFEWIFVRLLLILTVKKMYWLLSHHELSFFLV